MKNANIGDILSVNIGSNKYPHKIYLKVAGYKELNKKYKTKYIKTNIPGIYIDTFWTGKTKVLKTNLMENKVLKNRKEFDLEVKKAKKTGNYLPQFSLKFGPNESISS